MSVGTVNDPEKSYRLELVFDDEAKALDVKELLSETGIVDVIEIPNVCVDKGIFNDIE